MFKSLWSSDFFNLWLKCLQRNMAKLFVPCYAGPCLWGQFLDRELWQHYLKRRKPNSSQTLVFCKAMSSKEILLKKKNTVLWYQLLWANTNKRWSKLLVFLISCLCAVSEFGRSFLLVLFPGIHTFVFWSCVWASNASGQGRKCWWNIWKY